MIEITIPVLNEEKSLNSQIIKLRDWLFAHVGTAESWSIMIADNGSTDQTRILSEKLCQQYSDLKYIRLDAKGVGLALQTSWLQSSSEIIGYMDLDFATQLEHLNEVIKALDQGYDMVYATRLHPKSNVQGRTIKREMVSRCFNLLLRWYLKVSFSDGMCGFKFLKREKFKALYLKGARSHGWFFSTELLIVAEKLKFKIFELPVTWKDSKESHVNIIPLTIQYLKAMWKMKHTDFNKASDKS